MLAVELHHYEFRHTNPVTHENIEHLLADRWNLKAKPATTVSILRLVIVLRQNRESGMSDAVETALKLESRQKGKAL